MNVTRDVILDLLPLYVAGEASPATRELVEEFMRRDPELAASVRALQSESLAAPRPAAVRPELEMESLRRTRRVLGWQRWLLAIGVTLTALSLSLRIEFRGWRPSEVHLLLVDHPYAMIPFLIAGIGCLVAYRELLRRHRTGV